MHPSVFETSLSPLGAQVSPTGVQGLLPLIEEVKFKGSVERITHFNSESGQCIVEIKPDGHRSSFLVTGHVATLYPGVSAEVVLSLSSAQKDDFLKQQGIGDILTAKSIMVMAPNSARTLRKFLKSGALPGIPNNIAKVLSQTFPDNFFKIMDEEPEILKKVPGVGAKRFARIVEAWAEFKYITAFESYLYERRLPLSWARELWGAQAFNSLNYLKNHPYEAVKNFEFNFELIDALALKEGFNPRSMERVRGALYEVLKNFYRQGSCACPEDHLIEGTMKLIDLDREIIEEGLELELLEDHFILDSIKNVPCIYLKSIWEMERRTAQKFLEFRDRQPPWGWFNLQKVLKWSQSLLDIQLAPLQVQAIEKALSSSLTLITGGPGTGKTTLIRSLVTILGTQHCPFALCAPTGRGAQRLEEATGAPAQTIHRLLKYNSVSGEFQFSKNNPLPVDLVLVDEVSMVDLELMSHLLEALPTHCALILVGDIDQIPPVGAGQILQSLIDCQRFTTVKLQDIFRQSDKSSIKINAQKINKGEMPSESRGPGDDFHYIPVRNSEHLVQTLVNLVTRVLPQKYGIVDNRDIQVLSPLNRGALGTLQLNHELQQHLSPIPEFRRKTITGFEHQFKTGDKVMVVKNDYRREVFNGDIGFIQDIDHFEQTVEIDFEGRRVYYDFEELNRLTLAYAISIHKSQGSEYKAVIVVVAQEHLPIAQRQLIYTAVTRGKEHVFLVAEPAALLSSITSSDANQRWQKLTELLSA